MATVKSLPNDVQITEDLLIDAVKFLTNKYVDQFFTASDITYYLFYKYEIYIDRSAFVTVNQYVASRMVDLYRQRVSYVKRSDEKITPRLCSHIPELFGMGKATGYKYQEQKFERKLPELPDPNNMPKPLKHLKVKAANAGKVLSINQSGLKHLPIHELKILIKNANIVLEEKLAS